MQKLLLTAGFVVGALLTALLIIATLSAIGGALCMLAWNAAVVPAFGATTLTFMQAWGLFFLVMVITRLFRGSKSNSKD